MHHQPQTHYHLGLTTMALGYTDWAIRAFTVALELRPRYVAAHECLVEIYEALGQAEKAEAHRKLADDITEERRQRRTAREETEKPAAPARPLIDLDPTHAIIVVSGLPRSGTSMMMQMLRAGGVELLTDGEREADEDNPRGYYELETVKRLREHPDALAEAQGKAVKAVSMLLQTLPVNRPYKVIFMHRKLEQVVASQTKMAERQGTAGAPVTPEELRNSYERHLLQTLGWLERQPHIETLHIHHHEVLEDAAREAGKVNQFLGDRLRVEAMSQVVDPTLHRQRQ